LDFNRQPVLQPNNIIKSIFYQYTAVGIQDIFRNTVIYKNQVTSLGTGFEGEPIRECVTV